MKDLQRRLLGLLVASGSALRLGTVAAANHTVFSSCFDVTFEDVNPGTVMNDTEEVFVKSTLAHCWNNGGTNPYAEDAEVVLDVAVGFSDNSTATRGRRRLTKTKTYDTLNYGPCNSCVGDTSDHLLGDGHRRLRGNGGIGRRRLTFEDCFCAALMNSEFDAFENLTGCLVTPCPDARVTTVDEWVETVYIEPYSDSPTTASRMLQAATYHFEGGDDLVCRHDPDSPGLGGPSDPLTQGNLKKDNGYYRVEKATSEFDCKSQCMESADCCGVEYTDFYGKICKLWKATSSIGLMKQEEGFSCHRKVPDAPPEAPGDASEGHVATADDSASTPSEIHYEGGPGKSCRSEGTKPQQGGPKDQDAKGKSNKYFEVYGIDEGIDTLEKCKGMCSERPDCKGCEWRDDVLKRCEIWTSDIGLLLDMGDDISFECYRKAPRPKPNPVLRFGRIWDDDYGLDGMAVSTHTRYHDGDHWVRTGSSTSFNSDYQGFWWKSLGGFQFEESKYLDFVAGTMGVNKKDLSAEQVSAVHNFSGRMSLAARNFRASNRQDQPKQGQPN